MKFLYEIIIISSIINVDKHDIINNTLMTFSKRVFNNELQNHIISNDARLRKIQTLPGYSSEIPDLRLINGK